MMSSRKNQDAITLETWRHAICRLSSLIHVESKDEEVLEEIRRQVGFGLQESPGCAARCS
jgi:hypothetical protein